VRTKAFQSSTRPPYACPLCHRHLAFARRPYFANPSTTSPNFLRIYHILRELLPHILQMFPSLTVSLPFSLIQARLGLLHLCLPSQHYTNQLSLAHQHTTPSAPSVLTHFHDIMTSTKLLQRSAGTLTQWRGSENANANDSSESGNGKRCIRRRLSLIP
jgi:hypothetical protein